MQKSRQQLLILAAIAGMVTASAAISQPAIAKGDAQVGKCTGANACKGKSDCSTAKNECAGQNSCKGQGFVKATAKACKKLAKKHKGAKWAPLDT